MKGPRPYKRNMDTNRQIWMGAQRPPMLFLVSAGAIGLAAAIFVTIVALHQPWLGLSLAPHPASGGVMVLHASGPGALIPPHTLLRTISGDGQAMDLRARDLAAEPDGAMGNYESYAHFLERQGRLAQIQAASILAVTATDGRVFSITPLSSRPLTSLPMAFWVQISVGVIAWLISSAVFAFRTSDASARYLLLSGASTLLFASLAAVYSTRELALPATLFRWFNDLNFLGGSLFAASFVALLLNYPRRIGPAWLGPGVVALYLGWFGLQQIGVFDSMTFARRFLVVLGVVVTFGLAGAHWFTTRKDPVARAALQWFLLSWLVGTSVFALLILLPQMFGIDTSALQGYGFLLFLLVYGGLAFGILRYRLFELDQWWGQIVVWSMGIVMLVLFDLLFLLVLQLSLSLSLSLALLATGFVWLPLRAFVWGRLLKRPHIASGTIFKQVIDVALTPPGNDQRARWQNLLQDMFEPLYITPAPAAAHSMIGESGLALSIPAIGALPALRLSYAHRGRRLFTPREAALCDELIAMLRHAIDSRTAYEKGVSQERERIARDMHDNIGAQLLGALHSPEAARKDIMIRETLGDLREIINDAFSSDYAFDEMLAEVRLETAERLSASNIALDWAIHADADLVVSPPITYALRAIIREAASNVIKHADASRVRVALRHDDGIIALIIEDDGTGFDPDCTSTGNGLANMRERVAGLRGQFSLDGDGKGSRVSAHIPLGGERVLA